MQHAEQESANDQATPRHDAPRDAIPAHRPESVPAETTVQQRPREIAEDTEDVVDEDMDVDYEATSDEEECGPSSEEETSAPAPAKRQRLGQLRRGPTEPRWTPQDDVRIATSIEQIHESLN